MLQTLKDQSDDRDKGILSLVLIGSLMVHLVAAGIVALSFLGFPADTALADTQTVIVLSPKRLQRGPSSLAGLPPASAPAPAREDSLAWPSFDPSLQPGCRPAASDNPVLELSAAENAPSFLPWAIDQALGAGFDLVAPPLPGPAPVLKPSSLTVLPEYAGFELVDTLAEPEAGLAGADYDGVQGGDPANARSEIGFGGNAAAGAAPEAGATQTEARPDNRAGLSPGGSRCESLRSAVLAAWVRRFGENGRRDLSAILRVADCDRLATLREALDAGRSLAELRAVLVD